jgi:hypothetical protein
MFSFNRQQLQRAVFPLSTQTVSIKFSIDNGMVIWMALRLERYGVHANLLFIF